MTKLTIPSSLLLASFTQFICNRLVESRLHIHYVYGTLRAPFWKEASVTLGLYGYETSRVENSNEY